MEKAEELALPPYEDEAPRSYEGAPTYGTGTNASAGRPHALTSGTNLTLDPTGMSIIELPSSDAPPRYTLTKSLLHVDCGTSIHIKRPESKGGETSSLTVYAIGEHYISPLHMVRKTLRNVSVARSHGLFASVGLRKIVWDFSTHIPLKKGEGMDGLNSGGSIGPTDPVYLIGVGNGPGTVQKHLLQFLDGKWVDDDDEVLALEREGGVECEGMPVLSVMKDLDQEMMDFLVSAWCVTMWGEVSKRAHHLNKSNGNKLHIGKFGLG
jgi:hypothetical protein